MANFLADVGRSNILGQVSQTISAIDSMKRTDATLALGKEQIERVQRQNLIERQTYEEGEKPIAIETFSGSVLGGQEGKMFQNTYNLAKTRGLIDMSAGGLGTIKKRHLPEMQKLMSEPRFATQLSLDTIGHWRNNLAQVEQQLSQKPDDQKLIQAKQQAVTGLNTAMGNNAALQTELKRQAGATPSYQKLGGNLYVVRNGVPTKIITGSLEDKAYYNAMRDPQRKWIEDEQELYELVQMHKRILADKPKPSGKKDYGKSNEQDGATATNNEGVQIVTKKGRWVAR